MLILKQSFIILFINININLFFIFFIIESFNRYASKRKSMEIRTKKGCCHLQNYDQRDSRRKNLSSVIKIHIYLIYYINSIYNNKIILNFNNIFLTITFSISNIVYLAP